MGKNPGESTEENQQNRSRHSNLPFDETKARNGSGEVSTPAGIRRRALSGSSRPGKRFVRQVSWLPDPSPPGSFPSA